MTRKYQQQGGWIASFVVVGAILALGVLAGLYYLKNQATNANEDTAMTTDQKTAPDSTSNDNDKTKDQDKKTQNDKDSPKAVPSNTQQSEKSTSGSSEVFDGTSSASSKNDTDKTEISGDLPKTGPEDTVWQLAGAGLLTLSLVAYIQSRRHL